MMKHALPAPGKDGTKLAAPPGELFALSNEVVELFYIQAFSPRGIKTEEEVCSSFSKLLLNHWNLSCIIPFVSHDTRESLHEGAVYVAPGLDQDKTHEACALLAATVERTQREEQLWLSSADDNGNCHERHATSTSSSEVQTAFQAAGLQAGIGVPIYASEHLIGVLVAAAATHNDLLEALDGVRFIAAPTVIAVSNTRRAIRLSKQQEHIELLLEDLQHHSAALENANRELQRVAQYRSMFLARMSHELRTPLTSILGFTEILLDHEDLSDAQRRFCEKIQASGRQLDASLKQLVELSRLEAGQTNLFLHEFSLREVLRESCAAVVRLAQKQKVRLDYQSALELQLIVSDEGKLRQVLYNFLAFAISRSPTGKSVAVRAEKVTADGDAPAQFQIRICDEGEPIEDLQRIFEPGETLEPSEKGTNFSELGLAIAHRLINALGGTVKLESSPPCGLGVTLELPVRPPEE